MASRPHFHPGNEAIPSGKATSAIGRTEFSLGTAHFYGTGVIRKLDADQQCLVDDYFGGSIDRHSFKPPALLN